MSGDFPSAPATGATQMSMDATFTERPALAAAFNVGLQGAGVGLLVSSVQNSLQKHNKGAMGVFTRTGGTIGLFAGMGSVFTYVDHTLANIRQKDDPLNGAVGGCAAGFLLGLQRKSLPAAFGGCAMIGALIGTFDAAGRSISGNGNQNLTPEEREAKRRQFFKQRPLKDQVLSMETADS